MTWPGPPALDTPGPAANMNPGPTHRSEEDSDVRETWIVGIDGSESCTHALEWAVQQALHRDVRLHLIAAWEVPTLARLSGLRMASGIDRAGLEATAEHTLDEAVQRVAAGGIPVSHEAIEGDARSVLEGAAAAAELVVVGRRGTSESGPLHVGSVSSHCATHAPTPVVVVPESARIGPMRSIVVGVDESEHARRALRWAMGFATADVEITALRAVEVVAWLGAASTEERFGPEIEAARVAFDDEITQLDPEGRTTHRVVVGDPRGVLAEATENADLLVVGGRGHSGLTGVLLGSATTWLLHHTIAPMVVLPER
jgi:nucleotide-binding universal stress UspA family protein